MKKDDFARELMLGELKRENGRFITLRIIDRLVLMYAPLFERDYLSRIAEVLNLELRRTGPSHDLVPAVNH